MRVALCLFGQPRLLRRPNSGQAFSFIDNHTNFIINKYDTDVYAHCWVSKTNGPIITGDWSPQEFSYTDDENIDEIILNELKPKKFKFEKPRIFSLSDEDREKAKSLPSYSLNNENATLSQIYSITESINLIDNPEEYDFIIVSRYDAYIVSGFPDLLKLDKNELYVSDNYPYFSNVLILGGPNQIKTQACYDNISEILETIKLLPEGEINTFAPETFKKLAYIKDYGNEIKINMTVGIIRSDNFVQL